MFDLHTDTQTHTDSSRRVHVLLTLTAEDAAFTCRAPRLPLGAASPGRARTGGHHRGSRRPGGTTQLGTERRRGHSMSQPGDYKSVLKHLTPQLTWSSE